VLGPVTNRLVCPRHSDQAALAVVMGVVHEIRLYLFNAEGKPTTFGRASGMVWRCARQFKRAFRAMRSTTK